MKLTQRQLDQLTANADLRVGYGFERAPVHLTDTPSDESWRNRTFYGLLERVWRTYPDGQTEEWWELTPKGRKFFGDRVEKVLGVDRQQPDGS